MNSLLRPFLVLYCLFSLLYLGVLYYLPFQAYFAVLKVLPILLLVGLVVKYLDEHIAYRKRIMWALVLSACGDVALVFDGLAYGFEIGLGCFLLGHICYIAAFIPHYRPSGRMAINGIALSIIAGLVLITIWPSVPDLRIPVFIYAVTLVMMAMLSSVQNVDALHWLGLGGLMFVISDSLLVLNMFWQPIAYGGLWVMLTYYLAQGLLAFTWLNAFHWSKTHNAIFD